VVDESGVQSSDELKMVTLERQMLFAAKGGGITFIGRIFAYGSRFVIALVVARLLAAGQYGLYTLGLTAVELATSVASLGMGIALVRFVPQHVSQRDEARLWGTLQVGLGFTTAFSVVTGILLFVLADPIALALFDEPRLAPLLRLISFTVPFFNLSDMAAAATRGFKNMHYTVIAQNFFQPICRLVLVVCLTLVLGLNAFYALAAAGATEILVSLLLLIFLNRQFTLRRPWNTGQRDVKTLLAFSLPVYASSQIRYFGSNIKTVMLGVLTSVRDVGVFSLAGRLSLLGDMFQSSVVTASQPIIAELYSSGNRHEMSRFYKTMTRWSLTVNMPLFLILVVYAAPILSIFGGSFAEPEGIASLTILAWMGLVDAGTGICGAVLDMTDNTRVKLINTVVALGLSIVLSLILIPPLGLLGAALAALSGEVIVNLLRVSEVYILLRLLPYDLSILKPVLAGGLAAAAAVLTRRVFPTGQTIWSLLINIGVLALVYCVIILIMGLSPEDRLVFSRLKRRLGRMFGKR
jgi:O-antigen/teichoic acid export membrane protein